MATEADDKERLEAVARTIGSTMVTPLPDCPDIIGGISYRQWLIGQALAGFATQLHNGHRVALAAIDAADQVLARLAAEIEADDD